MTEREAIWRLIALIDWALLAQKHGETFRFRELMRDAKQVSDEIAGLFPRPPEGENDA